MRCASVPRSPRLPRLARRAAFALPLLVLPMLAGCASQPPPRSAVPGWHAAWRAETVFPVTNAQVMTCRFLARLSASGGQLRAEFTSRADSPGYAVLSASVAIPTSPSSLDVVPGTSRPLRFTGRGVAIIPGGQSALSDPIMQPITAGESVAVTVTASAGDSPFKEDVVEPGGCTNGTPTNPATAPASALPQPGNVRWLRTLLVAGPPVMSVAAFGDSTTEGPALSSGTYQRWSDRVADTGVAVANAGVGGGAVSRMGLFGTAMGTQRVTQLLTEPNLTDLVVLLGINDLALGSTSDQILSALGDVVGQARASGVRVWVGTITPLMQTGWSPEQEQRREQINSAIRGSWLTQRGGTLIDTDLALRDPAAPSHLAPAYDSGDHTHPNAAGASALGAAVVRSLQLDRPPPTPNWWATPDW